MEFAIGYLAGSGAAWYEILAVAGIILGVLTLIKAITGKDLS